MVSAVTFNTVILGCFEILISFLLTSNCFERSVAKFSTKANTNDTPLIDYRTRSFCVFVEMLSSLRYLPFVICTKFPMESVKGIAGIGASNI